jgi:hypothetical protein
MNKNLVAGLLVAFCSDVSPSATDCPDLTKETVRLKRTRLGVAIAEPNRFLRNHARDARRAEACRSGISVNYFRDNRT